MTKSIEYPFEYFVKTDDGFEIETPWTLDETDIKKIVETDFIYHNEKDDLIVTSFAYENGFNMLTIQRPEIIIVKTNWELDKMSNGKYLPRIQ